MELAHRLARTDGGEARRRRCNTRRQLPSGTAARPSGSLRMGLPRNYDDVADAPTRGPCHAGGIVIAIWRAHLPPPRLERIRPGCGRRLGGRVRRSPAAGCSREHAGADGVRRQHRVGRSCRVLQQPGRKRPYVHSHHIGRRGGDGVRVGGRGHGERRVGGYRHSEGDRDRPGRAFGDAGIFGDRRPH